MVDKPKQMGYEIKLDNRNVLGLSYRRKYNLAGKAREVAIASWIFD